MGSVQDHRCAAGRTGLNSACSLNTRVQLGAVDQCDCGTSGLSTRGFGEVAEGDKDAFGGLTLLGDEGAGKATNLIYANLPGAPPLALKKAVLAAAREFEVYVPIWPIVLASFTHRPPFTAEYLSNQPLELTSGQTSEIGRPLQQVSAIFRLKLDHQPSKAERSGDRDSDRVCRHEPVGRPAEGKWDEEADTWVKGEGEDGDSAAGNAGHEQKHHSIDGAFRLQATSARGRTGLHLLGQGHPRWAVRVCLVA
jgi:hypothetical protein